jgi:hypothetical protein
MLVKKLTNQQQLLAILKDRSAPPKAKDPPFALQRQTEATALCKLCKQMAAFTGLEARERMAVLKSFADDLQDQWLKCVFRDGSRRERRIYWIYCIQYLISITQIKRRILLIFSFPSQPFLLVILLQISNTIPSKSKIFFPKGDGTLF